MLGDGRIYAGPHDDPAEIETILYRATVIDPQLRELPPQQTMPSSVGPAEIHLGPTLAAAVWNIKQSRFRIELWGRSTSGGGSSEQAPRKWQLGSADVQLSKMQEGEQTLKTFAFKQGGKSAHLNLTLKISLTLRQLDQRQLLAQFRAQHRTAVAVFIKSAIAATAGDAGDADRRLHVANVLSEEEEELLRVHADYAKVEPTDSVSELLCMWVDLGIPGGGKSCGRLIPWLQYLEEAFRGNAAAATSPEVARLRMALIAIVDACIQAASDPIQSFCPDTLGSAELAAETAAACVRALATAGLVQVWEEPPRTKPKTDDVVLARLFELLEGADTTLARIKSTLIESFGPVAVKDRNKAISEAVINEMQSRRVRKGRSVRGGCRQVHIELTAALCENASYRYQTLRTTYGKVIRDWFESNGPASAAASNDLIEKEQHLGVEVLTLTRTIQALGREMEAATSVYQPVYNTLQTQCDVVWAFAQRYDKVRCCHREKVWGGATATATLTTTTAAVVWISSQFIPIVISCTHTHTHLSFFFFFLYKALARDLKSALSFLDYRIEMSTDKVSDLFDLYMVTRKFAAELTCHVGSVRAKELQLAHFSDQFEPFVVRWIRASQQNARMWAENSISADSWKPVTSDVLYSTSLLDISRGLSEILLLYRKLDWPDIDTATIVFTPAVINIVSDVAASYADQTRDCFLGADSPSQCLREGTDSWIVDTAVCCALNNLDEMASKVENLLDSIPVTSEIAGAPTVRSNEAGKIRQLRDLLDLEAERSQRRIREAKTSIAEAVAEWLASQLGQDLCDMALTAAMSTDEWESRIDASLGQLLDVPTNVGFLEDTQLGESQRAKRVHGYLCANMMAFATKLTKEETAHQLAFSAWERMLRTMRACVLSYAGSVPRHLVPVGSCYEYKPPKRGIRRLQTMPGPDLSQPRMAAIFMFILDQLVLFFSDDGDGLPHETVLGASSTILEPALLCCHMTTADLIDHFLSKAIVEQVGPLRKAEAEARGGGCSKMVVRPTDTKVGEIGHLRVRMNYNHAEDTLMILVLEADVPGEGSLYYKLRRLPISDAKPSKWRTDRRSQDSNMLLVPELSESGHALQLRVHSHSFVKTQKQTFVGEVLLCIQTIVQTTRPLEVQLPLEDGSYVGTIGETQHLVKQRSLGGDVEALSISALYSDI